ncbi:mannose-6-phosphate isomerase, class I [Yonghaparkia sp. Root332]|uniref:mannose-6-phosphate isomerase, class I n=1 Tax=Yonghaparkia sp. Root332 TaxID=1736516 RepID=UPI000A98A9C4|nr:mannose-6-phosphate isomerase, class I [Yonghaparkia sp. Root332]
MLIRITNTPRPYAWGSTTAIADLLGTDPSGGPEAELWLGAHPGSPARIVEGAAEDDLAQWAAAHAPGGRLPFLLKVLAASAPLSLQAHPTTEQARAGFERENAAGVPLDDPARNYRDPYAKPELLVALSDPFRALCGFRPVAEARADLAALDDARLAPLLERLTDDVLPQVVAWLIARSPGVDAIIAALTEKAAAQGELPHRPDWLDTVARLSAHHPGDPGIAVSVLMRTVILRPGEALYLPAGNIHAYLDGLGLELMEASDNVLRGGLTPKHVDVPELMRVLDARPLPPPLLEPEHPRPGIAVYRPEGVPLSLTVMEAAALIEGVDARLDGPAIILCLDGAVTLGEHGEHGELRRGEAALVAEEQTLRIVGTGRIAIASS